MAVIVVLAGQTQVGCAADEEDPVDETQQALVNAPGVWFNQTFENLPDGPLTGWQPCANDKPVVTSQDPRDPPDSNKHIKCKAAPGTQECVYRNVINAQTNGVQYFEFWARANNQFPQPVFSATKVMVEGASGKLFQVYMGSTGIRVNSGAVSQGLDAPGGTFVQGAWYLVSCDFDLDSRELACRLIDANGTAGADATFTMPPGNLTLVTIVSWDLQGPGAITLDDFLGVRVF
jgi:hypothetical protein